MTNAMSIGQAKLIIEDVMATRGHDRYHVSKFLWFIAGFGYSKFQAYYDLTPEQLEAAYMAWLREEIEKETEWRHYVESIL